MAVPCDEGKKSNTCDKCPKGDWEETVLKFHTREIHKGRQILCNGLTWGYFLSRDAFKKFRLPISHGHLGQTGALWADPSIALGLQLKTEWISNWAFTSIFRNGCAEGKKSNTCDKCPKEVWKQTFFKVHTREIHKRRKNLDWSHLACHLICDGSWGSWNLLVQTLQVNFEDIQCGH